MNILNVIRNRHDCYIVQYGAPPNIILLGSIEISMLREALANLSETSGLNLRSGEFKINGMTVIPVDMVTFFALAATSTPEKVV